MSSIFLQLARAALLPGVLDLTSSSKKKKPKVKNEGPQGEPLKRFVPKVYTKGSSTRKVDSVD